MATDGDTNIPPLTFDEYEPLSAPSYHIYCRERERFTADYSASDVGLCVSSCCRGCGIVRKVINILQSGVVLSAKLLTSFNRWNYYFSLWNYPKAKILAPRLVCVWNRFRALPSLTILLLYLTKICLPSTHFPAKLHHTNQQYYWFSATPLLSSYIPTTTIPH